MARARSMRERAILAVLLVVALYVGLALMWTGSQRQRLESSRKTYETQKKRAERETKLISRTDYWREQLENESSKMPTFPEGQDVDTWWWQRVDALAAANNVSTPNHDKGAEERKGDVYELQLDARGWESSLKSLVRFLCSLETAENAMFDIRDITINPVQKSGSYTGLLKTSFRLGCAYMRGEAEEEAEEEDEEEEDSEAQDATVNGTATGDGAAAEEPAKEATT